MSSRDWRRCNSYRQSGADLTNGDETQRIVVMPASSGLFEVLGVEPPHGGVSFLPEEETGDANIAVISYGLWHSAFAGDPDVPRRGTSISRACRTPSSGSCPPASATPSAGTSISGGRRTSNPVAATTGATTTSAPSGGYAKAFPSTRPAPGWRRSGSACSRKNPGRTAPTQPSIRCSTTLSGRPAPCCGC